MRQIISITSLLLLIGCTVGPDYQAPTLKLPEKWETNNNVIPSQTQSKDIAWWSSLEHPYLDELIKLGISGNLDIKLAKAKIRQSRAELRRVESSFFPDISGSGSAQRTHESKNTSILRNKIDNNLFTLGFDANWELDLFGSVQRAEEAAEASLQSTLEEAHQTQLSLIAEIAQTYIDLLFTQHQLKNGEQISKNYQKLLKLEQALVQAGLSDNSTLQDIEASFFSSVSNLSPLKAKIKVLEYNISFLIGLEPTKLDKKFLKCDVLPMAQPSIIANLPSEILKQRPDIRKSERELAVATANIGIAIADLFPKFGLTGSYDYQSQKDSNLLSSNSRYWTYGLNFSIPIFDFGKIRANIESKYALQEQAYLSYINVILNALKEVETALTNYIHGINKHTNLKVSHKKHSSTLNLMKDKHTAGLINYKDILEQEIIVLNNENDVLTSQNEVNLYLIAIYKALGGGWNVYKSFLNEKISILPSQL